MSRVSYLGELPGRNKLGEEIFIWLSVSGYESTNWMAVEEENRTRHSLQGSPPTVSCFRLLSLLIKAILPRAHKDSIHRLGVSPHEISGEALTHTFGSVFCWSPTELARLFLLVPAHSSPLCLPYYKSRNTGASQREWNFLVFPLYKSILSGILLQKREVNTPRNAHFYYFQMITILCVRIKLQ